MNLKDIYTYNKKIIWIIISILIIFIIGFIYFNSNNKEISYKNEYDVVLFGSSTVNIKQNEKYQDPGYYAILDKKIVTEDVIVDNNIDTTKPGSYEIKYTYKNITRTRKVNVLENNDKEDKKEESNIVFELIGDKEITLKLNEIYKESGVIFKDENGNDLSDKVSITGSINTNKVGIYKITYTINYNGINKSIERIINVVDSTTLTISNISSNYTNKDISVNVKAIGTNYLYLKFPDGSVSKDKSKDYVIKENGTYDFYAYDKDGSYVKKSITVSNIDRTKPTGTCQATVKNSKTTISVSASDNIGINYYIYNGKYKSKENKYIINSYLSSVTVTIYDKANNSNKISCSMDITPDKSIEQPVGDDEEEPVSGSDGNLEIHFMLTGHDDDGILIRTNNKTIMIDGGRYEDKAKVIPYLEKAGVKKIDLLIGSHVQYNHIQTQGAIADNFKVSKAIYSIDINKCTSNGLCDSEDIKYVLSSLKKNNVPIEVVNAGKYIELGEMKLYFIGPIYKNKRHNKNSLVFILQFRNTKYMFMGDCSNSVLDTDKFKKNASKWNLDLNVDVLKMPHHGYNDIVEDFYKATTPKYAMIPNGSHCSSKYPSSHNKNLMKKYNIKYYETCEYGNMVIVSDGKNISVKTNQSPSSYKR